MTRSSRIGLALLALAALAAPAAWWLLRPPAPAVNPPRSLYPVRGADLSAHNGDIDFQALASADSLQFVVLKATEGADFRDTRFRANHAAALQAGLAVGAYHFFRFDSPGYLQALNLLHAVRGRTLHLPLVIDVEEWANPTDRATSTIISELRTMVDVLEAQGYRVMLYSNQAGASRFLRPYFPLNHRWIASLAAEPADTTWVLWQYTHRGRLTGASGDVDLNVYRGSPTAFRALTTP